MRVLGFYERDGHSDASAAWESFTSVWNWSAPLAAALPWDPSGAGPLVRGVAGGFSVSGQWRLPAAGTAGSRAAVTGGRWLALRLAEHPHGPGDRFGVGDPDVFVVSSKVLPGPSRDPHAAGDGRASGGVGGGAAGSADRGTDGPWAVFRLADVYVPGGFATSSSGTPLGAGDAVFVWAAVAGMAFGAARRLTDALAALGTHGAAVSSAVSPVAAAAELAAALHDERLSLAARLHGVSRAAGARPAAEAVLAERVRRAGRLVHQVVSAAYEYGLACRGNAARDPLISLVDDSTPILQYMRYAVDLLPPDERTPTVEGDTR
ncbi:hypothetical protein [Streptomyces sp. NPDC056160]|uniref:hypothetical protein n=1 Tax=Streptomyces sp. NPDC056160 TaxID=3345731 RepID=UPI0035D57888